MPISLPAPMITYYFRVIDNITNEELLGFVDATANNFLYYGKCNKNGGESQYIVEFDIWNNEPAFNAGQYADKCADAVNCRLSIDTSGFSYSDNFIKARCTSSGYHNEFTSLRNTVPLTGITGNVNTDPESGIIRGSSDHALVQTKIALPENPNLLTQRYKFNINFSYDFE